MANVFATSGSMAQMLGWTQVCRVPCFHLLITFLISTINCIVYFNNNASGCLNFLITLQSINQSLLNNSTLTPFSLPNFIYLRWWRRVFVYLLQYFVLSVRWSWSMLSVGWGGASTKGHSFSIEIYVHALLWHWHRTVPDAT